MKRYTHFALVLALGATAGLAQANDNSMGVHYGESWYALQAGGATPAGIDVRTVAPAPADANGDTTRSVAGNAFRDDTAA